MTWWQVALAVWLGLFLALATLLAVTGWISTRRARRDQEKRAAASAHPASSSPLKLVVDDGKVLPPDEISTAVLQLIGNPDKHA